MQITSPDWSLARRPSHANHIARLVTCSSPIPCKSHRQIGKLPPLNQPLRFLAGTPMPSYADGVQCWPRNACQKNNDNQRFGTKLQIHFYPYLLLVFARPAQRGICPPICLFLYWGGRMARLSLLTRSSCGQHQMKFFVLEMRLANGAQWHAKMSFGCTLSVGKFGGG